MTKISPLLFDRRDHQLLQIVDDVLHRGPKSRALRSLLGEYMHPQGIKEMAAPQGLRIAYAVVGLLGTFETGQAKDRLKALRSLHDEVFLSSSAYYRRNTARVLLQIMKELVRPGNGQLQRLKLAHDFRMASVGTPRRIRNELRNYHLVEMPEEWNQYAFDDHVHDANTKGRKSPTHLIMDAWIKGIRNLTVVYYNYVQPEVIRELLEAGNILGVKIQVGIEISTRFRNKYVRFTWEPDCSADTETFLNFLQKESVTTFFDEGREVSAYQQQYVFAVLQAFNDHHRHSLHQKWGQELAPLQADEFVRFVGTGQPSILHLARFLHNKVFEQTGETMSVEAIIANYLFPSKNPDIHDPSIPQPDHPLPKLLLTPLKDTLERLLSLHPASKFTLNLGNLSAQDTLELLYLGGGMFTHLEAYNLKDAQHSISAGVTVKGDVDHQSKTGWQQANRQTLISRLQQALGESNVISLKNAIREIILDHDRQRLDCHKQAAAMAAETGKEIQASWQERRLALLDILSDLEAFHRSYHRASLRSRIGSGSTGQAELRSGMGFVVLDTLPVRARRQFYQTPGKEGRSRIPISARMIQNIHLRKFPTGSSVTGLTSERAPKWVDWSLDGFVSQTGRLGNIGTLGGLSKPGEPGRGTDPKEGKILLGDRWHYLNTNIKNWVKVVVGFIPAFFTFYLTKDWWLLAWFGALIWFTITGSRNIIQSVLGGGGLRRSPLLPWNSLVSWSRIADSLLFTGFSVPLLDFLVKTLLLDQNFGVTTGSNPVLLYSVMGLANGVYISSHNMLRGLPRGAAIGNFFRSILAIPVAIALNAALAMLLGLAGVHDSSGELQKWAAIISKFASDCVAAFIEGIADRQVNVLARLTGYRTKISQLLSVYSKLDLMYPEDDVMQMLQAPKIMIKNLNREARDLEKLIIVNALDLMHFWFYQPRSRKALTLIRAGMSQEEWLIFYRSQLVLKRHKEISQFFVDGLVGKHFSKALSFYLERSDQYLADMKELGK